MNIDITGRQVDVTPALREFAEDKLRKLERLLDGPLDIHVVLAIEKHRHMAEIQVKSRTAVFSGMQETGDLYASIGEVADKLERQALKHKEKLQQHKHRRGPRDPEIAAAIEANAEEQRSDTAAPAVAGPQIIRTEGYRLKPLSAEDAALELDGSTADVLVFRDSGSDRMCVIYRRSDGNFGLVEPEF
jgi:putative sigma-54 modulation protein